MGELKLLCTTLPSQRCESLLRSEIDWDRIGHCLQEWKEGGGILLGPVYQSDQRNRLKVQGL